MRTLSLAPSALVFLTAVYPAASQIASGALGGGVIDGDALAVAEAELDMGDPEKLALGLNLRLRFRDGLVLATDWDEPSDAGRLLRTFIWRREVGQDAAYSLAAGQLTGVTIGHGAIVNGYASGVDFERGRAGAELRARVDRVQVHAFVDDLARAEIIAGRVAAPVGEAVTLGVSAATDRIPGVVLASADATLAGDLPFGRAGAYLQLASRVRHGASLHGGLEFRSGAEVALEVRGEVRVSSRGTVPGWISPLYLRDREQAGDAIEAPSQTEHADLMGEAGVSGLAFARVTSDFVVASGEFATRPGLPWQATGQLLVPAFRGGQVGVWAVFEATDAAALAAEARVRLPRSLFARADLARQYRRENGGLTPVWIAAVSLGAVFGE